MTKPLSKIHKRVTQTKEQRDEEKALEIIKSVGRIPENKYWDDANKSFVELWDALETANMLFLSRIQMATQTPERRALIKDQGTLAKNIKVITKDVLHCQSQLLAIKEKHAGKTGAATTAEDIIQVMEIGELYRVAMCLYNDNVMPLITHALELLGDDEVATKDAIMEQAAQADNLERLVPSPTDDATDVNVITDVVVKEPTKEPS